MSPIGLRCPLARHPRPVRRLLERCLRKDPHKRLHDIADALIELEDASKPIASTRPAADGAAEPSARRRERLAWMTAAALLLGAAALLAIATGLASWLGGHWPTAHRESAVARLSLKIEGDTAENLRLPVDRFFTPFALSPDGTRLVFRARGNGRSQLFLRELSGFETRPIPGTEHATTPFFSPDGQLDRLLASGGSHPPQSLARGRFSDRNCSDPRTDRCALDIERRDRDRKRRSTG